MPKDKKEIITISRENFSNVAFKAIAKFMADERLEADAKPVVLMTGIMIGHAIEDELFKNEEQEKEENV